MIKQALALVGLTLSLSANAGLIDRGNGLIYDDVLNITWLQNANYAQTSGYAAANANGGRNSSPTNIQADGSMGWVAANAWAAQLSYGGYDDWRLASANLIDANSPCGSYDGSCDDGYNNTTGELGHMFYNNLGNLSPRDTNAARQSGFGVTNSSFTDGDSGDSVSILNLQNNIYWLGEEYAPDTGGAAWGFDTREGFQSSFGKDGSIYSWAVRTGDVTPVPAPAVTW
jgi:hypothetical protein